MRGKTGRPDQRGGRRSWWATMGSTPSAVLPCTGRRYSLPDAAGVSQCPRCGHCEALSWPWCRCFPLRRKRDGYGANFTLRVSPVRPVVLTARPAAPLVGGGRPRRWSATAPLCERRVLTRYGRVSSIWGGEHLLLNARAAAVARYENCRIDVAGRSPSPCQYGPILGYSRPAPRIYPAGLIAAHALLPRQ